MTGCEFATVAGVAALVAFFVTLVVLAIRDREPR